MAEPKRPTATHFYRYQSCRSLDRFRQILEKDELYFPRATELNDPAECRPRIAAAAPRATARFFMRTWRAKHPNATLGDCAAEFARCHDGLMIYGVERIRDEMTKMLHELSSNTRVLSMSKRWDNLAQWANYSGGHSGYCLEFANADIFGKAREVEYGEVMELDVTSPNAVIDAVDLFFRKRTEWAGEEEVRIIGPTFVQPRVAFAPAVLTRIILGKDMELKNRQMIRRWCAERKPPLVVVQAEYDGIRQTLKLSEL